ncbi:uncharacterized protein LOC119168336 isoform X2 [Rhipicephalus microplus]
MNACMQARDPGPCRASVPSWYFDAYDLVCKPFIYGGCQGNSNRFESKTACEATCSRFIGMKNTTATCMKKPDSGPCRAYILRWYYDHHHRVCKMFVYGGCRGNGNSFATEEKCRATCMPTSTDQGTCSADPKPRPCTARAQLWYFDHEENLCHRFTPGSCGSTANRFPTCRKCMMRCSSADAHKACSTAYKKIHYGKHGITWPGEMEPRVRGPSSLMDSLNGMTKPSSGFLGDTGHIVGNSGIGSSISNSSPHAGAPTKGAYGGLSMPVPGLTGPISNNGQRIPGMGSSLSRPSPGDNPPRLGGSWPRQPALAIPNVPHQGLPGSGLSGSQGIGTTETLSPTSKGRVTTGPHSTLEVGTHPSLGGVQPSNPTIPSLYGPSMPSALPLRTNSLGSQLPGSAMPGPGTVHAGPSAVASGERASNLKNPPLTIPGNLLGRF